MLNKILLRKIKFPLSLRGAFSFCHSRLSAVQAQAGESGNPSSLSLRGAKQACPCESRGSNLKGFSLIELMVAVVILSIAIFGIFQAYSVGFMGMADARDRTVATNYLRETLEDYKNMDFKKVKDEPITLIIGTKFHRGSIVLDLEKKDKVVTLKKVITQVRWMDRKGNIKTEEASTILYNKPNTSEVSNAAGIILYAQPYYTILPNTTVILTAEIKDENGNTLTDWVGDISFSIIPPPYDPENPYVPVGSITPDPQIVHTTNGLANIIFTAVNVPVGESVDGIEQIQASATLDVVGEVTDTVNIRVTTGAVGIILKPEPEKDKILPAGGTATINVTVVKADYITPIEYSSDITLHATGPGTLSTTTIHGVSSSGTTVTLTSNGTPGVVEITASAPDLDMGYTEITFTGSPKSIQLSAEDEYIYAGGDTNITITILDENNNLTAYTGNILITSNNGGNFKSVIDGNITFNKESTKIVNFSSSNLGKVMITASGNDFENNASINLEVLESLTPSYIQLMAIPPNVEAYGDHFSVITATVCDSSGKVVSNYSNDITFSISGDEGVGYFNKVVDQKNIDVTPDHGVARVYLYSSISGNVNITVSSFDSDQGKYLNVDPLGGVNVEFYGLANKISITAVPNKITSNGEDYSIVTATVCDVYNNIVTNYGYDITFFISGSEGVGYFNKVVDQKNIDVTPNDGVAQVYFYSSSNGTANITASSYDESRTYNLILEPGEGVSVTVEGPQPTELTLVDGSVKGWFNYTIVRFDIKITGTSIDLGSMQLSWDTQGQRYLNEIGIKSPKTESNYDIILDNESASSPFTVNDIDKKLVLGYSEIQLTFKNSMLKRNISITFIDKDEKNYPTISFTVPK